MQEPLKLREYLYIQNQIEKYQKRTRYYRFLSVFHKKKFTIVKGLS